MHPPAADGGKPAAPGCSRATDCVASAQSVPPASGISVLGISIGSLTFGLRPRFFGMVGTGSIGMGIGSACDLRRPRGVAAALALVALFGARVVLAGAAFARVVLLREPFGRPTGLRAAGFAVALPGGRPTGLRAGVALADARPVAAFVVRVALRAAGFAAAVFLVPRAGAALRAGAAFVVVLRVVAVLRAAGALVAAVLRAVGFLGAAFFAAGFLAVVARVLPFFGAGFFAAAAAGFAFVVPRGRPGLRPVDARRAGARIASGCAAAWSPP